MIEKLQALIAGKTGNLYSVPSGLIREALEFVRTCANEREEAQKAAAIQARDFGLERDATAEERAGLVSQIDALHAIILEREKTITTQAGTITELEAERDALAVKLENTRISIERMRRR